jgi:sterol desaturase/sphingolipid hydroxylase (fatty acid hydroxylase superfamily)
VTLAIWDRLFGSWVPGDDDQALQYGTGKIIDQKSVLGQWWYPIGTLLKRARRRILGYLPPRKPKNAPRI